MTSSSSRPQSLDVAAPTTKKKTDTENMSIHMSITTLPSCCRSPTRRRGAPCSGGRADRRAKPTREERLVGPVATELAAHQETVGQLVLRGHRDLLQHLVDASEEPFVVEPLLADAKATGVVT